MKYIILLAVLGLTGCSTTNITRLVEQLKDDPATVSVSITSVYGNVKFVRSAPRTNQTVAISPDGTVVIGVR